MPSDPKRATLRWEEVEGRGKTIGFLGGCRVCRVVGRFVGRWNDYRACIELTGLDYPASSLDSAKLAAEQAVAAWLDEAGLVQREEQDA